MLESFCHDRLILYLEREGFGGASFVEHAHWCFKVAGLYYSSVCDVRQKESPRNSVLCVPHSLVSLASSFCFLESSYI